MISISVNSFPIVLIFFVFIFTILFIGGYTEQRAKDLIITAFSQPLPNPTEMVRFMFTVGGGKLVRSRYPDDLTKWLVAALREINFTEDRSAACTLDSQGTFKQQHDTDQNLKYLFVFPHVSIGNKGGKESNTAAEPELDTSSPVIMKLIQSLNAKVLT